jgi:hypothetical protein
MDHNRVDHLSYMLADTRLTSRRGVLAALGIVVLGAIAGVEVKPAHAKRKSRQQTDRKSRHHTKHKSRHASKAGQHGTQVRLDATRSKPSPKPIVDSRCQFPKEGEPCQEAICTSETTLSPACACDEQGQCVCPDPVECANHLTCEKDKAACLTDCAADADCANGYHCEDGTCTNLSCDCSNLDFCNGNGRCTSICTCVCDVGWSGAACSELPEGTCSDHLTCEECEQDTLHTCVFCASTQDGATGVCVPSNVCLIPVECQ